MEDKYFESTIVALLENHDEFTAVNLSGHSLHGDRMSRLAKALSLNTHLNTLELHEVKNVTEDGWAELARSLPRQLHTLDLSDCDLNQHGVFEKHICPALDHLPELSELDLSSNNATLPTSFFTAVSKMSNLSELLLQHNSVGNEGILTLISHLHPTAPLERIWLQNNGISLSTREKVLLQVKSLSLQCADTIQFIFGST